MLYFHHRSLSRKLSILKMFSSVPSASLSFTGGKIFPSLARAIKMAQVPLSGPLIGGPNGPARVCHFAPSPEVRSEHAHRDILRGG